MEAESRPRSEAEAALGSHQSTGTLCLTAWAPDVDLLLTGAHVLSPTWPTCASSCQSPESGKGGFLATPDLSPMSDSPF